MKSAASYYIGVDVGTGSVRACLTDDSGSILAQFEEPLQRQELLPMHITQSGTEIWKLVCACVRSVAAMAPEGPSSIRGLGFDATCSLVVLNKDTSEPIAVGPNFADRDQNVILWMDHRAEEETRQINSTGDPCLQYVGGKMSIEMELPKILWLKNNISDSDFNCCKFFDLPDYLTFCATGLEYRSFCSAVCKQGLVPNNLNGSNGLWSESFFIRIGLESLAFNNFERLQGHVEDPPNFKTAGMYLGHVSAQAATQLGITTECIVGSAVIDAYAGWIGTVGTETLPESQNIDDNENGIKNGCGRLAAVAGTSTCFIALSNEPMFVDGVWGPYRDVLARDYWCTEGGQSCTGALLDYIISSHPARESLAKLANDCKLSKFDYLNELLNEMTTELQLSSPLFLIKHMYLYGDYHGNRSPIADPNMRATLIGQSMDVSIKALAKLYLAACEFIALQTRQIIEVLTKSGHSITAIYMSGGQCRNRLLVQLIANCTGLAVVIPKNVDTAVVFGSAILGAVAYKVHTESYIHKRSPGQSKILWQTMQAMTSPGQIVYPIDRATPECKLLEVKYKIFLDMAKTQKDYRAMIDEIEY